MGVGTRCRQLKNKARISDTSHHSQILQLANLSVQLNKKIRDEILGQVLVNLFSYSLEHRRRQGMKALQENQHERT